MSKLFEQLLKIRGLDQDFLHPDYQKLTNSMVFPDMDKAVARIRMARERQEKIFIYGDYDVDGVTASTALAETLRLAGISEKHLAIMLPDRFVDGYGMSWRLVQRAGKFGATLVITVDCGSRNLDIIDELALQGVDTIITDHHECGPKLPNAVAILNPKRSDFPPEHAELRNLAGVGVVFKLAEALVQAGLIPAGQEKWLLDLVLIGTICDSMPLTGENRILCYYGIKVLAKTRRVGLRELMRRAKVHSLSSDAIGFQLGPRLNAAGRLETADLALKLLNTTSASEAAALSEQLELLNQKRKSAQQAALQEISARLVATDPVLVATSTCHEGIVGIVAGRLMETYQRPTFVLTEVEKGILKGSGRSFGDFNLAEALDYARDILLNGGGHAAAAGVRLESQKLPEFRTKINDFYRHQHLADQQRFLVAHADLTVPDFADFTLDFLDELALLEPFGEGHQTPLFQLQDAQITAVKRLGTSGQHLRLDLADAAGRPLKLMAFFAPEHWLTLTPSHHITPLIQLERNEFNGITSVEGRIIDIPQLS